MDSPSSNYRPQIIVALIGVAGVLGASLLSNWDKIIGNRVAAPTPQSGAGASPADPVKAAVPPEAAQSIPAASAPDISGNWRTPDGYVFQVEQNGRAYSFQQYAPNGTWVGSGSGQLADRKVRHNFRAPGINIANGQCSGDLDAGARSISGSCLDKGSGAHWGFRIDR